MLIFASKATPSKACNAFLTHLWNDRHRAVGISPQAMNSFEKGRRRVPVSQLPIIAQTLGSTLDALVSDSAPSPQATPGKRGPQKKIQRQLERIEALPLAKQRAITQVLESVIAAHQ